MALHKHGWRALIIGGLLVFWTVVIAAVM
jgi:hypothetical protein